MSAKLLMGLSDENPELEKQIGCMTGFFQVFDRHRLITGRRSIGHNSKKLPSGEPRMSTVTSYAEEHNTGSTQIVLEYSPKKSSKENRRKSMESSPSLSSSPSSSFSSLEGSNLRIEAKYTRNDFRDVVKDSINAETRVLSAKTTVKDVKKEKVLKHIDSPRPTMSIDLSDSVRVLVRLKEAPWNDSEAPRFSCDGREISRSKSSTKLRELPRLSLDSREGSLRSSNLDAQYNEMGRSSPHRGIPSVVAKLMGLEALPDSASPKSMDVAECNSKKSSDQLYEDGESDHGVHPGKSPLGSSQMGMLKNAVAASKHGSKKTESVFSQIERRVKELEFSHSNRDLRALKHILDKMQAMELIESKGNDGLQSKETSSQSQENQSMKPEDPANPKTSTTGAFNSPIVIMKPARPTKKSDELEGLSGLRRLRTNDSTKRKKAKDQAPKVSARETYESSAQKSLIPQMQRSPRPQQPVRERSGSPGKSSSSSSPRAQQRKLEQVNKPQPSTQKRNAKRKPLEPVSPNGNLRVKQSPAAITCDGHARIVYTHSQQHEDLKSQNGDISSTDSAIVLLEQPSPVSVLEAAFYQDDLLLSPVNNISCITPPEGRNIPVSLVEMASSKLSAEIHLQKLYAIKNLVERLRLLGVTDEANTQEEPNHDHLSQILGLAGLSSKDLISGTSHRPQSNAERLHQELMFDVVKEMLTRKVELISKRGPRSSLFIPAKKLSWQCLCSEIKQLALKKPFDSSLGEEEDLSFREDLLRQSDGWDDFGLEVPGLVLEIERSIFKDLIDEIVAGEACSRLQAKANRRCRQLFS